jgi:membrane protein DedA with SNARE-associated domain
VEEFFRLLHSIDPVWVYALVLSVALLENIFPPAPSDIMIVAAGSLVGMGHLDLVLTLVFATIGSTSGFMIMYKIGEWFGDHILEQGKIRFIPIESVHRVEKWFTRYGYAIIVINRFLTGTRAVVSFFAGMSELKLGLTTVLCAVSALIWNGILIASGVYLGHNWERIGFYLNTYSHAVTAVVIVLILLLTAKYIHGRRGTRRNRGD